MSLVFIIFLICLTVSIAYLVYIKREECKLIEQVTPITRGERSERKVILELLKAGVNPKAIFHDLYIQKPNGEYTQVDVVVATAAGIIVFEVKDYSGWIFGNEHQKYWTQLLAFGNSEFKNITCHANNTFIIYPHSIQRVISEILTQPNAVFGNKYEIMDLFTKAVQNGNNPMIVASQINSAAYHGRNKPQSTYTTFFDSSFRFRGFPFRRRFW